MAITKYRVTMRNVVAQADGQEGTLEAVDYVPTEILDAYVSDARTRWQSVEVSDEPDFGPAGPDGPTVIPDHLQEI